MQIYQIQKDHFLGNNIVFFHLGVQFWKDLPHVILLCFISFRFIYEFYIFIYVFFLLGRCEDGGGSCVTTKPDTQQKCQPGFRWTPFGCADLTIDTFKVL